MTTHVQAMAPTVRDGRKCVTLLHRVTGASSEGLAAAIATLTPAERARLDALAGEILDDARDVADLDGN